MVLKSKQHGYFLGIDGGGSKCKAVIANQQGDIVGRGIGGPANPFCGVENTKKSIITAAEEAIASSKISGLLLSNLQAGIGLAGVNLPSLYEEIIQWNHPFSRMVLTTDMDIANIGAHDGHEGAIIIVGTGTSAYIDHAGVKSVIGGYGFPIGDQASGAWMGLKAVEHTLLVFDGFVKKSMLSKIVSDFYSASNGAELSEAFTGKSSKKYAKIASVIFDCADKGDPTAGHIINQGLNYITQLSDKVLHDKAMRLSMIGGLAQFYLPLLSAETASHLSAAIKPPEVGALHLVKSDI